MSTKPGTVHKYVFIVKGNQPKLRTRRVRMSPEHTTDLVHSVTALIHAAR